jgi:hypothetical protein
LGDTCGQSQMVLVLEWNAVSLMFCRAFESTKFAVALIHL